MKAYPNDAYDTVIGEPSTREVSFNISHLRPELDRMGKLTLKVPVHAGSIFAEDYVKHLSESLGEPQAEIALEQAADKLFRMEIAYSILKQPW